MLHFRPPMMMTGPSSGLYGTHTYWRVFFTDANGGSNMNVNELEMRSTAGGADECNGGTATASSTGGGSVANAFDNNASTLWASSGNTNEWLAYEFPSPVEIVEVAMSNTTTTTAVPYNCTVQYSDNGSTWTDAFSFVYIANNTLTVYPEEADEGFHRVWRIFVSDVNGGSRVRIGELEFRATAGGADQTVYPGTGLSGSIGVAGGRYRSSSEPLSTQRNYRVWDGSASAGGSTDTGTNEWVEFIFPTKVKVEEILMASISVTSDAPRNFRLDYSDDLVNYTTQYTFPEQTGWGSTESRVLTAI